MNLLDELRKKNPVSTLPQVQEGLIWVNILIKYGLDGTSKIVQSYTSPASDSVIKRFGTKKKEKKQTIKIEESGDKAALF